MIIQYDFEIAHRAGVKHQAADDLTRLPTVWVGNTELDVEMPVMVVTRMKGHNGKRSVVPDGKKEKR